MAYVIYQFDGLVVPTAIQGGDEQNMGTGEALSSFQQLPGGGFYDNYGTAKSPQGIRPITKSGIIHATTAALLVAELDALRVKLGVRGKLTIRMDDGSLRWQWARLTTANLPRPAEAAGLWLPFDLQWVTAAQVWYGIVASPSEWVWGDGSWIWGDGTVEFGANGTEETLTATGATTQALTLNNGGNINATNVQVTVTAGTATITAITWANATSGYSWTWTGTVAVGEALVIDSGSMSVTNDGDNAYSGFTPSHKRIWDYLVPGDNAITLTVTGNGAVDGTVGVAYYDHFA